MSKTDSGNGSDKGSSGSLTLESGISIDEQRSVQKLQHVQAALKHLQVNRVKDRYERQTLSALLQEEKEKCETLLTLNKKLTFNFQVFKKRLEDNHLSTVLDGKSDTTKAQTSRLLLTELMKENAELKEQLTECSKKFNPELRETLAERVRSLEDMLERELYEKQQLQEQLKQYSKITGDEKDERIAQLENKIKEMKENRETQEVLAQSLTDELVNLNQRLQATAKIYQEVVLKLKGEHPDEAGNIEESLQGIQQSLEVRFPQRRIPPSGNGGEPSENQEMTELKNKVEKLKSENIKVKGDLSEAIDVNKRWNTYNQQREKFVKKQQDRIQLLETKLKKSPQPEDENLKAELENLKKQHGKTCKTVSDLKSKLESITKQRDEYRTRFHQSSKTIEDNPMYKELKDTVYHLQAQVQTATEDFQNERGDREKAHSRVAELEAELAYLKRYQQPTGHYGGVDLRSLERDQRYTPFGRCAPATSHASVVRHPSDMLVAKGPTPQRDKPKRESSGSPTSDNDSLQTNPDLAMPMLRAGATSQIQALRQATAEDVQCPRCGKCFPSNQHHLLLEHMDTCCD